MNRPMIVSTSLVALTLIVGVCHAATEEYAENLRTWEVLFGDGKRIKKLYSGKRQPDAGLAQILVLPGLTITAVDGHSVRSKWGWLGYKAYKQLPGPYEFEVTSWKRRSSGHYIGKNYGVKSDKQAAYALQVVLKPGQKYVLSPIWNDGEMGILSPSQVCLQGHSDNARYCALRPRESDDVSAMDEKHGVIVVGLAQSGFYDVIILINLDCEWKSARFNKARLRLNTRKAATKLRDVCYVGFRPMELKDYMVESVDAGVWQWWGIETIGKTPLITTLTFDVDPGKVNYVGHVGTEYTGGKLVGFSVEDRFSLLEPIIRARFGDAEIVNQTTDY